MLKTKSGIAVSFDYFEKIICVSLKSRQDRREECLFEFQKIGIKPEFYDAVPGGMAGFNKTQINLMNEFKGLKNILVLEDDIQFTNNPTVNLHNALKEIPEDWEILYLGANLLTDQKRYSDHLYHCNNAWTTHAIAYNGTIMTHISNEFHGQVIYDQWLRESILPNHKCFIINPMIATQRPSQSDIFGHYANYEIILQSQKHFK